MTWGTFQAIVGEMLTVNANRRGTELLRARAAKNCAVDLQRMIRGLRQGHVTNFVTADLTLYTKAMLGSLPSGAIPQALYIVSTRLVDGVPVDPNCQRNRLDFRDWVDRNSMICGCADCRSYLYAISPYGNQFLIYPALNDETYLKLVWEGIKSNFADGDDVPFPEESAEAFAAYIQSRIFSVVDKNPVAAQAEMLEYRRLRLGLYRDYQERKDAEKPDQEYVDEAPFIPSLDGFGAQQIPFLRNVIQLLGIDGDTTALSAIPTTALDLPFVVEIQIGGNIQQWSLQAGTTATGPGVQQPNDFNSVTNAKVWIQLS